MENGCKYKFHGHCNGQRFAPKCFYDLNDDCKQYNSEHLTNTNNRNIIINKNTGKENNVEYFVYSKKDKCYLDEDGIKIFADDIEDMVSMYDNLPFDSLEDAKNYILATVANDDYNIDDFEIHALEIRFDLKAVYNLDVSIKQVGGQVDI